jgi:hypothetical protein
MNKPTKPANLADVSTWTREQMAYAAPIIVNRAVKATSDTFELARKYAAEGTLAGADAAAQLSKTAKRYMETVLFWQSVQLGESPKVPAFLKSQRVRAYQQTNQRHRAAKTRFGGQKDWGIWG